MGHLLNVSFKFYMIPSPNQDAYQLGVYLNSDQPNSDASELGPQLNSDAYQLGARYKRFKER